MLTGKECLIQSKWEELAVKIGIPSARRHLMEAAFNV